ncbi:hypothetical protein DSCA_30170 [Desulfosarcina alkanivorans]|jgi:hypothetical protein|uniref:Lipoprotein n=1 Tax=Desulfosarcina alkanivorans TaxID=571177 RepID=A0A5K7YWM8_9BACT|nr:hypothetical protein [Desulfosarcina alkanivorans]BBO69087.1 hypothetical protein DSCA_30170 [Desulfosarcina alkanivorans]
MRNPKLCHMWTDANLLVGIALVLTLTGCMTHYGHFSLDARVRQAFQAGSVQPEFQYYYTGRETMPYAIIGIDRGYTVPSRYWIPFSPRPDQLKAMSANIYREIRDLPYGAYILDPAGQTIGIWYSNVFNRNVTVDQARRKVQVLYKNPENKDRPR